MIYSPCYIILSEKKRKKVSVTCLYSLLYSYSLAFSLYDRECEEGDTVRGENKARPLDKICSIGCPTFRQRAPLCLLVFALRPGGVGCPRIQRDPLVPSLACRGQPMQRDAACSLWLMLGCSSTGGALCLELKGRCFSSVCNTNLRRIKSVSLFIIPCSAANQQQYSTKKGKTT